MTDSASGAKSPAGPRKVLIFVVDDEPMLLELAVAILDGSGYDIKTFRDPELALKEFTAAKPRPDLVVTDYQMHNMNGMELIESFRRIEPKQPILLISGTVGTDIFEESPVKPDAFLAKPYLADQFTRAVAKLLKRI